MIIYKKYEFLKYQISPSLRSRSGSRTTVTRPRRRSRRKVLSLSLPAAHSHRAASACLSPAASFNTLPLWLAAARLAQMPLSLPTPLPASIPRLTFHHSDLSPSPLLPLLTTIPPSHLFYQPTPQHLPSPHPPRFHQHFSQTTTPFSRPLVKT